MNVIRQIRALMPEFYILALLAALSPKAPAKTIPDALKIYDQTADTVTRNFYDRTFRSLPWEKMVASYRTKLGGPVEEEELKRTINDLLDNLHASHTEFLSDGDQEYWGLKSIFSHQIDGAPVEQIGAWFVKIRGRWFIRNIFSGSPAEKAGLLGGDEIVSVNDKPLEPVRSFTGSTVEPVKIAYRRSPDARESVIEVVPELRGIQSSLLRATLASRRVILRGRSRIGYFHLWAGTHPQFKEALTGAAQEFSSSTDAFILDLRDGFGGTDPSYLNPFFDHDDAGHSIRQIYSKPMVVLINGGTRSGKEWITYLFKQTKRATLVGSRTAGYFLAGMPFEIKPGMFLLYLAVSGDGPSGVNLEGKKKGVVPDIYIGFELPYSAGKDPQLEAAISKLNSS